MANTNSRGVMPELIIRL